MRFEINYMFFDAFITIFDIIRDGKNEIIPIIITSLKVSSLATLIATLVGMFAGFLLYIVNFKGKKLILLLLNTALAVPTVVVGLFLYGLLSRRGLLGNWGILYTQHAIVFGQVFLILPIVIAFVHSAIKSVNPTIIKTARALGAGPLYISLALASEARFGIVAAIIAAFGRAVSEVGISMMLGGNIAGYTRNMTTAIALEHNKGNFALGLALGILLLFITFIINILLRFLQERQVK